jgi:drug/metabolite transporter (DMT)-like permease
LPILLNRTFIYTAFALLAFAFNSVLCRLALRGDEADAAGFTAIRLASGAVSLIVISYFVGGPHVNKGTKLSITRRGSWSSAFFLFSYAICFSFAYLGLSAGTGALILFGSVQVTMIGIANGRGERPRLVDWLGLLAAVAGLVYLVLPGLASPPTNSALLMAAAGASWGLYTLRGKGAADPLANTTGNFVRSLPMIAAVVLLFLPNLHLTKQGLVLAILSGSIASGVGYTLWYAALRYHTTNRAAILQLPVPLLTAFLGVLFLNEPASSRLAIAAAFILGGIGITIIKRS